MIDPMRAVENCVPKTAKVRLRWRDRIANMLVIDSMRETGNVWFQGSYAVAKSRFECVGDRSTAIMSRKLHRSVGGGEITLRVCW